MGILEWKKYDVFGGVLVPMEFGEPQQIGFRIPNRGPWACDLEGPGGLTTCPDKKLEGSGLEEP